MEERKAKPKPFQNSLRALAQFALNDTRAEGYAFFRGGREGETLIRDDSFGADISEDDIAMERVVTFRFGHDGILAFSFPDEATLRQARPQLDRVMLSIEAVWLAAQTSGRFSELANEVADLEVRLMDSKIADRVRGFLDSREEANPVEAIARHVEGILRPHSAERVLEQMSKELEAEVEERRLTNRAKVILQNAHGISEEQAHIHLRQTSRKTRRKLKDVALHVIEHYPK